ncbi:hypothetical protein FO519_000597 [Halicephalobus sp. NKZ332]|nr:hypothetical protein FO519_000597 [Halicephalobus sp. NKZ332]
MTFKYPTGISNREFFSEIGIRLPDYFDSPSQFGFLKQFLHKGIHDLAEANLRHKRFESFERKVSSQQRLLVAVHDFKGNYLLEDTAAFKTCDSLCIPFLYPAMGYTDMFVYFSHHFLGIPPDRWIHSTHTHGKLVLGTVLIENKAVENLNHILLDETFPEFLAELMEFMNFDGYLINIEMSLSTEQIELLRRFLQNLRSTCKARYKFDVPIIWYDAVTTVGNLEWQNELNETNAEFFLDCGFFLTNYGWTAENVTNSLAVAGKNSNRVLFGIDMFGRGTHSYGPGVNGLLDASEHLKDSSLCIFAPGYHHEQNSLEDFNSVSLLETFHKFFAHLQQDPIALTGPLRFGSPFEVHKITKQDDDIHIIYKLARYHVFPKFGESIPRIADSFMRFSEKTVYQSVFSPKTLKVTIFSEIINGGFSISPGPTNVYKGTTEFIFLENQIYDISICPDTEQVADNLAEKNTPLEATVINFVMF